MTYLNLDPVSHDLQNLQNNREKNIQGFKIASNLLKGKIRFNFFYIKIY
jgi:hypothetical protein